MFPNADEALSDPFIKIFKDDVVLMEVVELKGNLGYEHGHEYSSQERNSYVSEALESGRSISGRRFIDFCGNAL